VISCRDAAFPGNGINPQKPAVNWYIENY